MDMSRIFDDSFPRVGSRYRRGVLQSSISLIHLQIHRVFASMTSAAHVKGRELLVLALVEKVEMEAVLCPPGWSAATWNQISTGSVSYLELRINSDGITGWCHSSFWTLPLISHSKEKAGFITTPSIFSYYPKFRFGVCWSKKNTEGRGQVVPGVLL